MKNHNILLIAYFGLLAVLIGGLASMGMKPDMPTIIEMMVIAAAIFATVWLIWKWIKRKMSAMGYNRKQLFAVALGVDSDIVDAIPGPSSSTALVPATDMSLVPYVGGDGDEYESDELPTEFIAPGGLPLAEVFQPSIHILLASMTIAILGIRRSGKSNCLSVIIEALAPHLMPMLICDTKDEYAGLVNRKFLPHGYMAGAPGATANVPDEVRFYYIAVDEDGAFEFGKNLMEGAWQVVLNLKSYETDDQAARVMCRMIKGMNAWQEARPNKDRVPAAIALDEAHKWLPQNQGENHTMISKETVALLQHTFFSIIVRLGGANGLGFIVASQRISELDKRCLQSTWKFLFRQTETVDINKYEEQGLTREDVLSLRQGECFVFSPLCLGFRVQMYAKKSPDLSRTPGLEQLARHRQVAHAKHEMLARKHSYSRRLDMPEEREAAGGEVDTEQLVLQSEQPKQLTPEQQRVLECWHKGTKTHREIAAVLDIAPNAAYTALIKLDSLGYIERKKKVTA